MASILPVSNETISSLRRTTQDGRELLYEIEVIQQPERARACGSGAKSSADRRPVDPPPVVELRIYEGPDRNDITFSHNANFFLFTTLEHARPMAQGRGPISQNITPVLTGMPVAGMAYLDRPNPAGYFIFPDLSVRHEGKYRLSFNLYEELKDPHDADMDDLNGHPVARDGLLRSNPMTSRAHVHYRLEVKSAAFDVYSAKKFPGLSESTHLSRLVAEQGCRVRIRRDVRMRRRDKCGEIPPDLEDDYHHTRSERFPTPRQTVDRPRSISHGSMNAHTEYNVGRPPAMPEAGYYQPNYQQHPPSAQSQSASSYHSHLSFGGPSTPHYQTPPVAALPIVRQGYPPTSNGFHYTPPLHARQLSAPQNYGYVSIQPTEPGPYAPPTMYMSDEHNIPIYCRGSAESVDGRKQPPLGAFVQDHQTSPQQLQELAPSRSLTPINTTSYTGQAQSLPPVISLIRQTPMEPKLESASAEISAMPQGPQNPFSVGCVPPGYNQYASGSPQSTLQNMSAMNQNPSYFSSSVYAAQSTPLSQSKRTYASVFDSSHLNEPMYSGMRPNPAHQGKDFEHIETDEGLLQEDENDFEAELMKPLIYKRADGTRQAKKCPSPRVRISYHSYRG